MSSEFMRNPHLEGNSFFWQGSDTGVLLIHGFTATTAEVRLLGEYLRDRGYTVSAPLLPGHGTTPQDLSQRHWQDWASAVEQAFNEMFIHCERIFIVGESMGALLALYMASEYADVTGILVFAPALVLKNKNAMRLARLLSPFIPYVNKPVKPKPDATDARWKGYLVNPTQSVLQLGALQGEVRRRLPRVTQPLFVGMARFDDSVHPSAGDVIMNQVKSTEKELYWFEKSTHCVLLDQEWEQAAEMVVKFIERIPQG